jgi:hypothetical protein
MIHRRKFLFGLGGAVAAPAIVKASSLMKLPPRRLLSVEEIVKRALDMMANEPLYGVAPFMQALRITWINGEVHHTLISDEEFYENPTPRNDLRHQAYSDR